MSTSVCEATRMCSRPSTGTTGRVLPRSGATATGTYAPISGAEGGVWGFGDRSVVVDGVGAGRRWMRSVRSEGLSDGSGPWAKRAASAASFARAPSRTEGVALDMSNLPDICEDLVANAIPDRAELIG
jgi:hypothetical protein